MNAAPRKRRRWRWLFGLALLLLCAWFGLRFLLQPARLSAFLLQQAEAATGLRFTLEQPADVGVWPDLHLVLQGLTVRAPNDAAPILRGDRVELVLPWSALRGESLRLRELRLMPMVLDLDALLRWLDTRAELGPPAPLRLPQLNAGLHVTRSRITYGEWVLADVDLQLLGLRAGESSTLTLGGILSGPQVHLPFQLKSVFVPRQAGNEIRLEPLAFSLQDAPGSESWLEATGRAALDHPQQLRFAFDARLPRWPVEWPALPLPLEPSGDPRVSAKLAYAGTPQLQGALELQVSRAAESLSAQLQLGDLLAWTADRWAQPLPPLHGAVAAPRLQLGAVQMHGVRLRLEADAPAATGTGQADDGDR